MRKFFSAQLLVVTFVACAFGAQAQASPDMFHGPESWAKSCVISSAVPPKQSIIEEIFPTVIYGTPGRNLGSEQLFAPVTSVGHPIASLASFCMRGNATACYQFSGWIETLADKDALKFDREKHKHSQSSLVTGELAGNSTLRPIAIYTAILRRRGLINVSDRKALFDWMHRRVIDYSHISGKENQQQLAQNLVLNSAATQLAVGITTSDPSLLSPAENVYHAYIDTMRDDGSFPQEAQRGQSALKYENDAIALLILIAELDIIKGKDLYMYRGVHGDIHKAIRYWVNAMQDEALIRKYASAMVAPTDPAQPGGGQALYFLRPQRDMMQMGWIIPYLKRFPNGYNSEIVRKLIKNGKFEVGNEYDSLLSVYPRCLWGG